MAKWWEEAARDDNAKPRSSDNDGDNWDKPSNPSGDTGAKSPDNSHKGDQK